MEQGLPGARVLLWLSGELLSAPCSPGLRGPAGAFLCQASLGDGDKEVRAALTFLLPLVKEKQFQKPLSPLHLRAVKSPCKLPQLRAQSTAVPVPQGPRRGRAHTALSGLLCWHRRTAQPAGHSRNSHPDPQHGQQTQPRQGKGISPPHGSASPPVLHTDASIHCRQPVAEPKESLGSPCFYRNFALKREHFAGLRSGYSLLTVI